MYATLDTLLSAYLSCDGLTTDSRHLSPGSFFVALRGDRFDGHAFVETALNAGVRYALVDQPEWADHPQCLLVEDTLKGLQDLARAYRDQFSIPVIGLTGSNGKTTNKELLAAVLAKKFRVHATVGNLNNHIGVPLTLLRMPADTEIAVIEMGANHQQEIADLCQICAPTHGFITNIGKAHLEGFGGIDGVRKGKGELYDYLLSKGGEVFLQDSVPTLPDMVQDRPGLVFKSYTALSLGIEELSLSPQIEFKWHDTTYRTHLAGAFNFDNIVNALFIGTYFGVAAHEAAVAVAAYTPANHRSQRMTIGSNTLWMDAYNANPSSMHAALTMFMNMPSHQPKAVILGDMFELGDTSAAEHAALGQLIAQGKFTWVVLYGENMQHALPYLPKAFYFNDKFSLHNWLIDKKIQDHFILIKGSRGVALESVVTILQSLELEKLSKDT